MCPNTHTLNTRRKKLFAILIENFGNNNMKSDEKAHIYKITL